MHFFGRFRGFFAPFMQKTKVTNITVTQGVQPTNNTDTTTSNTRSNNNALFTTTASSGEDNFVKTSSSGSDVLKEVSLLNANNGNNIIINTGVINNNIGNVSQTSDDQDEQGDDCYTPAPSEQSQSSETESATSDTNQQIISISTVETTSYGGAGLFFGHGHIPSFFRKFHPFDFFRRMF